jgi:ribosome-associated translation inhibitor RaiA
MIDLVIPNGFPAAGARVRSELTRILEAHGAATARASVTFTDENGPKGGRAMRCAVSLTLPRRTIVHAEHTAPTLRLALDGMLDKLERELARFVERRRDAARHPKKYYAAKRILGTLPTRARRASAGDQRRGRTS